MRCLALVVIAGLFGTTLWLSTNAVADALARGGGLSVADLGHPTSAVRPGFIVGTLLVAVSGLLAVS